MMRWLAWLSLSGCIIVDNRPPEISWAEVTCGHDAVLRDWVWTFEADVWDARDAVRFVDAHVYDDWTNDWVDSFALDPERRGTWFGAWSESQTALYCGDAYVIDFVAEDDYRSTDVFTVRMGDWWPR